MRLIRIKIEEIEDDRVVEKGEDELLLDADEVAAHSREKLHSIFDDLITWVSHIKEYPSDDRYREKRSTSAFGA